MYSYEGIGWYDSLPGGPLVYRFINLRDGSHFYTASSAEVANVNERWGYIYRYEGVAWGGEQATTFNLSYSAGTGGTITGTVTQTVDQGSNGT